MNKKLSEKYQKIVKLELPVLFQAKSTYNKPIIEVNATEKNEAMQKLLPNTWGMPAITFRKAAVSVKYKPLNVGVVLSGGPAPGGHNVIAGIFDCIKRIHPESKLFGFLG
jgi:hypothetical protein